MINNINEIELIIEEVEELYEEHKTLTAVADIKGCSVEKLRQFFIANEIEYTKQAWHKFNENFFNELNEKSMYWLGFIASDGNISKYGNRLCIALKKTDDNHLVKFKTDIQSDAPIRYSEREEKRPGFIQEKYYGCSIRATSKKVKEKLKEYNIVPAKSLIYTIPECFFEHQHFNHFLRGLIDGDGWIRLEGNNGCIGLCGNKAVVKSVMGFLIKKLDLKADGAFRERPESNVCAMGFLRHDELVKIVNYLYPPDATVWLDRKEKIAKQILKVEIRRKIEINKNELDSAMKETDSNFEQIAKLFDCSEPTVRRRAIEHGLYIVNEDKIIYDETIFDEQYECEKQFYLAGYLAQSGSLTDHRNVIVFNNRNKNEILFLYDLFNSSVNFCERDSSYGFRIFSKKIYSDLKRFGINENKTNNFIIHEWIKTHKYLNHFLRGCVEAKNSAGKSKDGRIRLTLSSANKQLIIDISELFKQNCNIANNISVRTSNICNSHTIKYSKNAFESIARYLYGNANIHIQEQRDLIKTLFSF